MSLPDSVHAQLAGYVDHVREFIANSSTSYLVALALVNIPLISIALNVLYQMVRVFSNLVLRLTNKSFTVAS